MVGGEENIWFYERSNSWFDEPAYSGISHFMLYNEHY